MRGQRMPPPDGTIRIVVPADPRFLAALRVAVRVAAGLGDLSHDDIDDMQIAADEAATLLLAVGASESDPALTADLTVSADSFQAVISVAAVRGQSVARDGLAWLMLIGIDPEVTVTYDDPFVSIAFGRVRSRS